jgi:hypothetical protein
MGRLPYFSPDSILAALAIASVILALTLWRTGVFG